jgi:hypothetical protein
MRLHGLLTGMALPYFYYYYYYYYFTLQRYLCLDLVWQTVACEPQAGCCIVTVAAGKLLANIVFTNRLKICYMGSMDMNVYAIDCTLVCGSICDSDFEPVCAHLI